MLSGTGWECWGVLTGPGVAPNTEFCTFLLRTGKGGGGGGVCNATCCLQKNDAEKLNGE